MTDQLLDNKDLLSEDDAQMRYKIKIVKKRWSQMCEIYGESEGGDLVTHVKTYYPHLLEFYMKHIELF